MSWQVTVLRTGAANLSHSRRWVSACLRDRAGPLHARRGGLGPPGALLRLGGQLLPGGGLALLPLAVLVPDGPPAARLLTRRVHGDAVLQLDNLAAGPGGGAPGPVRENPDGFRASGRRPLRAAGSRATARLWGSCGDLDDRGRCLRHWSAV